MWKRMKLEYFLTSYIAVLQSHSCVWIFVTPWTAAWLASKLMSLELVMPSNHLILCHPLPLPPTIFPIIRVFSNESALCSRWPKYWSSASLVTASPELSHLITRSLQHPLTSIALFPTPLALIATFPLVVTVSLTFLDSMHKWGQAVFPDTMVFKRINPQGPLLFSICIIHWYLL